MVKPSTGVIAGTVFFEFRLEQPGLGNELVGAQQYVLHQMRHFLFATVDKVFAGPEIEFEVHDRRAGHVY
jgi:hypothetical protein